jgi:hypothetical protein
MARSPDRSVAAPTPAFTAITPRISAASNTPPVATETAAPASSSAVGALTTWSSTVLRSDVSAGSGIVFGP